MESMPISAPLDHVPRAEIEEKFESLRRELELSNRSAAESRSTMTAKLDQLLAQKFEDARAMGALQEQVRTLFVKVSDQGTEIAALREKIDEARSAPKDSLLKIAAEIAKLLVAGLMGYLIRRGMP
jgi:hypothetical protein